MSRAPGACTHTHAPECNRSPVPCRSRNATNRVDFPTGPAVAAAVMKDTHERSVLEMGRKSRSVGINAVSGPAPYRGKRTVDWLLLGVLALPAALVGAVCALGVRIFSGAPVLFRQERTGWRGQPFTIVKFRTMVDAPEGNPLFPDPDRITAVGRVLRRLSLDELPQLVNVARGEMSIVGPRPTLPYQAERYDDEQRRRLDVRPGLTGLAQIRGRASIDWGEKIEHDLEYIARQSWWFDLSILLRTGWSVLSGAGVGGHPEDDPIARLDEPDGTAEGTER